MIELLIVIGVLSLLLALVLPSIRRSVRLASSTACMSNLRQISQGLEMYRSDQRGWLPISLPQTTSTPAGQTTKADQPWFMKLMPRYVGDIKTFLCPSDPFRQQLIAAHQTSLQRGSKGSPPVTSYGISSFISRYRGGMLAQIERRMPPRPTDTILLSDLGPDHIDAQTASNNLRQQHNDKLNLPDRAEAMLLWNVSPTPSTAGQWFSQRHAHHSNMLSVGGSITEVNMKAVVSQPVQPNYPDCAAGGCTICNHLNESHLSFAKHRMFWWTGIIPE